MLEDRERLAPASLVAVSHATPEQLRPWIGRLGFHGLIVLADPERIVYDGLGLRRARWSIMLDLRGAFLILRGLRHGLHRGKIEQDWEQLGADLVLAPGGRVAYLHRSRSPGDVPSPRRLRREVAQARR
ncbi:MAG: peroxiredoxin-like family protein [Gaiellales bacterium]